MRGRIAPSNLDNIGQGKNRYSLDAALVRRIAQSSDTSYESGYFLQINCGSLTLATYFGPGRPAVETEPEARAMSSWTVLCLRL